MQPSNMKDADLGSKILAISGAIFAWWFVRYFNQHSQQTFGCLLGTVDWCFFPIKMESLNLMSTWVKGMPSDQHPFLRKHFNTFAFSKLQLQQSGDPTAGAEQCISHPSEEVYMQEELTRDLNTKLPPATKAGWLAEVLPRCSSFGGFGYNCL